MNEPNEKKTKFNITIAGVMKVVLWITFILALASSVQHIAWTAGTLESDPGLGWLTAIAIDATLAVIAYAIQQKRRLHKDAAWLWIGLVVIAIISALANVYHALYIEAGKVTTTNALMSADWLVWTKAVVLSGLLPLLVVFLGEVISSDDADEIAKQKQAEDDRKLAEQKAEQKELAQQRREDARLANEAKRLDIEQQKLLLEQQRQQEQDALKQNQSAGAVFCERCQRWFKNRQAKAAHKCNKEEHPEAPVIVEIVQAEQLNGNHKGE